MPRPRHHHLVAPRLQLHLQHALREARERRGPAVVARADQRGRGRVKLLKEVEPGVKRRTARRKGVDVSDGCHKVVHVVRGGRETAHRDQVSSAGGATRHGPPAGERPLRQQRRKHRADATRHFEPVALAWGFKAVDHHEVVPGTEEDAFEGGLLAARPAVVAGGDKPDGRDAVVLVNVQPSVVDRPAGAKGEKIWARRAEGWVSA